MLVDTASPPHHKLNSVVGWLECVSSKVNGNIFGWCRCQTRVASILTGSTPIYIHKIVAMNASC